MKQLQCLCESFIERAERPMLLGSPPISAKEAEAPIFAVERWREVDGALYKTYRFRRTPDRNSFVMDLFAYEATTEHTAQLTIKADQVAVRVYTKDLERVTEVDKEYAKYCDVLFKNIVYAP